MLEYTVYIVRHVSDYFWEQFSLCPEEQIRRVFDDN